MRHGIPGDAISDAAWHPTIVCRAQVRRNGVDDRDDVAVALSHPRKDARGLAPLAPRYRVQPSTLSTLAPVTQRLRILARPSRGAPLSAAAAPTEAKPSPLRSPCPFSRRADVLAPVVHFCSAHATHDGRFATHCGRFATHGGTCATHDGTFATPDDLSVKRRIRSPVGLRRPVRCAPQPRWAELHDSTVHGP